MIIIDKYPKRLCYKIKNPTSNLLVVSKLKFQTQIQIQIQNRGWKMTNRDDNYV